MFESVPARFWTFAQGSLIAALLCHFLFIAYFGYFGVTFMVALNVGSLVLYSICLYLLYRHRPHIIATLISIEVVVHGVAAVWFLGLGAGFQFHLFLFTGWANLFLLDYPMHLRVARSSLWSAPFFLVEWIFYGRAPMVDIGPDYVHYTRLMNIGIFLIITVYLGHYYSYLLKGHEKRLQDQAHMDLLTGLHNRHYLKEAVLDKGEPAGSVPMSGAALILDVDHFKKINDNYGHAVGDKAIQHVADIMRSRTRSHDHCIRWGGEEFVAVLADVDRATALEVAERMRRELEQSSLSTDEGEIHLTMTIGLTVFEKGEMFADIVSRADSALYEGKKSGRNKVVQQLEMETGLQAVKRVPRLMWV